MVAHAKREVAALLQGMRPFDRRVRGKPRRFSKTITVCVPEENSTVGLFSRYAAQRRLWRSLQMKSGSMAERTSRFGILVLWHSLEKIDKSLRQKILTERG